MVLSKTTHLLGAFAAALAIAFAWGGPVQAASPPPAIPAPVADHHMHIFSAEAVRASKLMCAKMGPMACPLGDTLKASTGADVLQALDAAGVRQGVLLSTGYFYGSPELKDAALDIAKDTRAENAYVVEQAKMSCARLAAFVSINPVSPFAVDEVRYWGRRGGASGVKLHLGNSDFSFRDPAQVKALAAVFKAAADAHLAIVIHMQTRAKDYGAEDAAIFLRDVEPYARGVPLQIAHAAGGGGVDAKVLAALGVFADAMGKDPALAHHLYFDLAMVPDLFANVGKIRPPTATRAALRDLIHRIGLAHFLTASDWTAGLDLKAYYADEKESLGLTDAEWAILAASRAPYLPETLAAGRCSISH
jgi:hypothetical protein